MKVLIAGGRGKIALEPTNLLAARGEGVVSLIRNPDHGDEVGAAGAVEVVACDLVAADGDEVATACGDADAIVLAAGAGAGG